MIERKLIGVILLVIGIILTSGCLKQLEITEESKKNLSITPVHGTPDALKEKAMEKLSHVRVVSLYERVTDRVDNRSVDDVINLLKETKTDLIFRGWWRWFPPPESQNTVFPPGYPSDYVKIQVSRGYTYQQFRETSSKIKKEIPDIIFIGAIPAERINFLEENPINGKTYKKEEVEKMKFDPNKWGVGVTQQIVQQHFQSGATSPGGYFPDITNPEFQELLLSWAKKQIDYGADGIWIDMLFTQPRILMGITKDPNHPAVKDSYEAASKIVDEIHNYGYSKGKYIYVGSWNDSVDFPYPPPNLDFITATPSSEEIYSMKLDENKWDIMVMKIREKLVDIPIFTFIDWATADNAPMATFSQKLTPEKQRDFLRIADQFFEKKGINFIYPVHGGWMSDNAKILSVGKDKVYDSLVPEFNTYETIKELAQNKSKLK